MKLTHYKIAQLSLQNILRSIKKQKLKEKLKPPPTKKIGVHKFTKNND